MNGRREEGGRERSAGLAIVGRPGEGYGDFSEVGSSTVAMIAGCKDEASDIVDGVASESVDVVNAGILLELSSEGLGGWSRADTYEAASSGPEPELLDDRYGDRSMAYSPDRGRRAPLPRAEGPAGESEISLS